MVIIFYLVSHCGYVSFGKHSMIENFNKSKQEITLKKIAQRYLFTVLYNNWQQHNFIPNGQRGYLYLSSCTIQNALFEITINWPFYSYKNLSSTLLKKIVSYSEYEAW